VLARSPCEEHLETSCSGARARPDTSMISTNHFFSFSALLHQTGGGMMVAEVRAYVHTARARLRPNGHTVYTSESLTH
jgi:hypothetical protein